MTTDPIIGLHGQIIMTGWIDTDPHTGTDIAFVYLATPGTPTSSPRDTMPLVAQAFGLDPAIGTMTEHPATRAHLTFAEGGWARLELGDGKTHCEHPGSPEFREVATARGQFVLVISHLPMPAGLDQQAHIDHTTTSGQFSMGLLPVTRETS